MKSLARLHICWQDIDCAIETHTKSCTGCTTAGRDPTCVPLHQWELPLCPWQQVHVDYARPFKSKMWLLLIDSFSKWPEVVEMTDKNTSSTISKLKHIFGSHGLLEQIVSDNSLQFTAKEFKDYCCSRGILHKTTAPYHPRLNGEVERRFRTKCH